MRVIDLSLPLDERTPFYPGDPRSRVRPATTIAADGFAVSHLELGSHSGTHCDAPSHFLEGGPTLEQVPLERFVGAGVLVDAADLAPRAPITWDRLAPLHDAGALRLGVILLLRTGWDAHRADDLVFDHPHLAGECAERLVGLGVLTVGIDALNLDPTPTGEADRAAFPCHAAILGAGGVIVENLAGLAALRGVADPLVSVLPLSVPGSDGAPARAVAFTDGAAGSR